MCERALVHYLQGPLDLSTKGVPQDIVSPCGTVKGAQKVLVLRRTDTLALSGIQSAVFYEF